MSEEHEAYENIVDEASELTRRDYSPSSKLAALAKNWPLVVSTVALLTTTLFQYKTSVTTQQTLAETRYNYKNDERAWLEFEIEKELLTPPSAEFMASYRYKFSPKNVGKSVARKVVVHAVAPTSSMDLFESKRGILLYENEGFKNGGTGQPEKWPTPPGPQSLAPQSKSPVPVVMTGQAPQIFSSGGRMVFYLIGKMDYDDVFGVSHWKTFCYLIQPDGSLLNCMYGNDVDDNPEPK